MLPKTFKKNKWFIGDLQTTRFEFPVPLGTASLKTASLTPVTSRQRSVDDVTSWPYFDLIDAWRPKSVELFFYVF